MVIALGTGALAAPFGLRAQPLAGGGKRVRVCLFSQTTLAAIQANEAAFVDTMREQGWGEDRNIVYDRVYANDEEKRLPSLAAALVSRGPDLIFAPSGIAALAALAKTQTVPIVFGYANDPIEVGLVKSLAHPGGNVTGITNIGPELGGKRLQLLKEVLPMVTRVGVLVQRDSTEEQQLIERAAATLRVTIIPVLTEVNELDAAFALLTNRGAKALLTTQTSPLLIARKRILELAAKQRMPVVGPRSEFVDDGALMSYGSSLVDQVRRAAQLADKILRGTKPADIPVERPTKFDLALNRKTAKALGIKFPSSIMLQATKVIE